MKILPDCPVKTTRGELRFGVRCFSKFYFRVNCHNKNYNKILNGF